MTKTKMAMPKIVSKDEWLAASEDFLVKEKKATRAKDELAAERRRLPMVKIDQTYTFEGPNGKAGLLDLFDGRRQLILYHFMFGPNQEEGCPGCSFFTDQVGHLAHLHARDTSYVIVSRAPTDKIEPFKKRMAWTIPWYSSFGSDFNADFGVGPENPQPDENQDGESFGLSVFLHDADSIFRTYFTSNRGAEALGNTWSFLDLSPLGRQETWEDSPAEYPQTPPYEWWRHHDKYDSK